MCAAHKVQKPGYLWSLFHYKCARCRSGDMFQVQHTYRLRHFMKPTVKKPLHLEDWFSTDARLHKLYPESIRSLARMHWSPLYIIQKVIPYLAPNDTVKVLDIGSGVGTFCLAGAFYKPSVAF